jgi:hypothetical protein
MSETSGVKAGAEQAAEKGKQVAEGPAGRALVTVGLITYGVVHLLFAWIALQLAWGLGGGDASQKGAMAQLAGNPVGLVVLWVTAIGMLALVVWQGSEAIWGHREQSDDKKRLAKRLGSAAKAVVYAVLAWTAFQFAIGSGQSSDSDASKKSMSAKLMSVPAGRILVVLIGVAILGVGVYNIWRGATKKFTDQLQGGVSNSAIRLGQVGYIAKGIAFGIVGVLFVIAGITHDPNKAGGTDQALKTLLGLPFGQWLLTLVALGIAAFGAYCFVWSRHAKD